MAMSTESLIGTVSCPLGDDVFQLSSLRGTESVSAPFQFECTFISEQADIDFDALIGQPMCIKVGASEENARYISGVVARFSQAGASSSYATYHAELVPWLWFLTRSTDCRIWHDTSAPDIVKDVFDKLSLTDYDFNDLTGSFEPIPYCVQYRETDFNFVSRMLEDAGIAYYFKHEKDHHTLVLFNSPDKNAECPSNAEASYVSEEAAESTAGIITDWYQEKELRSGAWAMTDYNYEDPSLDLGVSTTTSMAVGGNERFEVFDYPGDYTALQAGSDIATLRMEAEEAACQLIQGSGTCTGFTPGYKFDLRGHYRESFDGTYLITSVTHHVSQSVGGDGMGLSTYQNSFSCRPHSVPYRPLQVTPAPVIQGIHTATVVGEEGTEIDIDSYGSVLVHFPWDRENKYSCRARVAHNWAGKEWGFFCAPRIGQEVLIQFIEGDPRRPIVIGRVYNAEQMPPYGTGEHSGIKSRSTPEGSSSNFNEIRLEDKKGEELFFIQAEKDQTVNVKNDVNETIGSNETQTVGADQSITVGSNRTDNVGQNETRSVGADRTRNVGKNETVTIALTRTRSVGVNDMINVGAAQEITVGGAQAISVGAAQTTNVGAVQNVSVGANRSVSAGKNISEEAGDNYSISAGKDYALNAAKNIVIEAGDQITIKTGDAQIVMKKSGDIDIQGKKITLKGSGDIVMKGKKILQN
jgi:type VI secretion system secreted protein VgrG